MWIIFLLFSLGALHSTVSSSPPSPINVNFSSVNLRNLLQWSPGNDTPSDTHYTAQYAIYGDSVEGSRGKRVNWRSVRRCTEVTRCWCDLSNETWDLEEGYYARVRAVSRKTSSKWASTWKRFDPKSDTIFGPPLVVVDREGNNAIITLKGPMRYQPNNQTPAVSMATLYDQMTYNISVHNVGKDLMSHFQVASSQYKYCLMEYDTKYCFSARTKFLSMPVQCQSSEWQCITTPPDPLISHLKWVVVGIVVPFACMCVLVVIGFLLHQYLTGQGQKSPFTGDEQPFHSPPPVFHPETPIIVPIKVGLPLEEAYGVSDPASYKKQKNILDPPPSYAAHGSDTPPGPAEPRDDESLDYGFVCKASETHTRDDGEERERRRDGNNERKEWRVDNGRSADAFPPQEKSTRAFSEAPMSILAQREVSTQACSSLLHKIQASSFMLPKTEEDREFLGLFVDKNPQTGLFSGKEAEMESRNERAPLLSAYASQTVTTTSTSQSDQSSYFSDDYGVLSPAEPRDLEADEEEEGSICINWDPQTRKLVLPEMGTEFKKGDELLQGEEESEGAYVTKGGLRLENVFVTQGSEEKAEALREMREREEKSDDPLSKWDLVFSMDP